MKSILPSKFAQLAMLAGALTLVSPNAVFAQRNGGGGNRGQGFSGQRGGGQTFSGQRNGGAQSFSGQRGGQSFSGQRGFSGGQRFSSPRGFSGGARNFTPRRDNDRRSYSYGYRGYYPSYGYRSYGYYGYGYYPGYSYYSTYCNPNGFYDQWGVWYPDPRCSYDPYYYGY